MGNMKALLVKSTVWGAVMIVVARMWSSKTLSNYNTIHFNLWSSSNTNTLGYNTVNFNSEGATPERYSTFVDSLRRNLGTGKEEYGIPVTVKKKPLAERYLLVELTTENKFITLVMNVTDLYVVGYRDINKGKKRFNYLRGFPKPEIDQIFKKEKDLELRDIGFDGSYGTLEGKAKSTRKQTDLGVSVLKKLIGLVSGNKPGNTKDEAKFFLVSIQMVAEAARFKYIENSVLENGISTTFRPDDKVTTLENEWGKISEAIYRAIDGKIIPELEITFTWKVNYVKDIAPYVGLLKYKNE